uniref:Uncharacterized protein n=1 Tax=Schistocephalus solidus TaxID=70667 RepID=A0A0V0JAE7_SCHSO
MGRLVSGKKCTIQGITVAPRILESKIWLEHRAAVGFSSPLWKPTAMGLQRNIYVTRTSIQPLLFGILSWKRYKMEIRLELVVFLSIPVGIYLCGQLFIPQALLSSFIIH